ncbi:MAG: hypothetical protein AAGD38_05405 [Acidobacteriota bacterium]
MTWMLDLPQIVATGAAVATFPVLLVAQAARRGRPWALIAGAALQALVWVAVVTLLGPRLGPADWLAGGSLLVALWLGWFQVISVLHRGFSLQLMVELAKGAETRDELAARYANGRGLDWLLDKRIRGLEAVKLARRHDQVLQITPRGLFVARIARLYKHLTGIGAGG